MRAHYLQHVFFEGLGCIEELLKNAGYEITSTAFFRKETLPKVSDVDFLVVLGGPMSANDEEIYPWLKEEKNFIKDAVAAGIPTLGICLGAQLIASAFGAEVRPNAEKEIGWFPVIGDKHESAAVFAFPSKIEALHWHGETFDLPPGAVRLATSTACANQAFQLGANAIGLQFHLEMTPPDVGAIITNCRAELVPANYVQTAPKILSAQPSRYRATNALMSDLLAYLRKKAKV